MLSNAYLLAKFRFDTAEIETAKNLQNFAKKDAAAAQAASDRRGELRPLRPREGAVRSVRGLIHPGQPRGARLLAGIQKACQSLSKSVKVCQMLTKFVNF